mmetsp:Transcript_13642/g.43009  ORF Transcript_13642/g.43009 Transcript_13642/m.43009 type:complete len:209 (-) Transcript_13642:32-658(-)
MSAPYCSGSAVLRFTVTLLIRPTASSGTTHRPCARAARPLVLRLSSGVEPPPSSAPAAASAPATSSITPRRRVGSPAPANTTLPPPADPSTPPPAILSERASRTCPAAGSNPLGSGRKPEELGITNPGPRDATSVVALDRFVSWTYSCPLRPYTTHGASGSGGAGREEEAIHLAGAVRALPGEDTSPRRSNGRRSRQPPDMGEIILFT